MKSNVFFITKKSNLKRNVLIILTVIITIAAVVYDMNTVYTKEKNEIIEGLSNSLIRFHVIANSDSVEDQNLKIKVKDEVIKRMQSLLQDSETIEESRKIILANIDEIKKLAEDVDKANGYNDNITVNLEQQTFPLKQYGDVVLPPGKYEALVIRIGAAQGKNWWCILFPPLCFVDATHGVIDDDSKAELKNILTDEEYASIIMDKDKTVNIKVKSKLLQWFEDKQNSILKDTLLADIFR